MRCLEHASSPWGDAGRLAEQIVIAQVVSRSEGGERLRGSRALTGKGGAKRKASAALICRSGGQWRGLCVEELVVEGLRGARGRYGAVQQTVRGHGSAVKVVIDVGARKDE